MFDHYNLNCGPLWNVKLLPWSPSHTAYLDRTLVPAEASTSEDRIPEPPKHRYVNHVIIGWHHSIVDGHSCIRLIRNLLRIIDDLIAGKTLDESVQVSSITSSKGFNAAEKTTEENFSRFPELLNNRMKYEKESWNRTIFQKVIKLKPYSPFELALVPYCLDFSTTQKFILKCKQEEVSVHSGFCTVINAAIINILQSEGFIHSLYNITTTQTVSTRSLHNENEDAFGLEIDVLSFFLNVPNNVLHDFWNCARDFHKRFKQESKHSPCEKFVAQKLAGIQVEKFLPLQGVKELPQQMRAYQTSNMLDVTNVLGFCGNNVHLEYIEWSSDISLSSIVFFSSLQTLRGRLFHSLKYNTGIVGEDTAQKLSRTIFSVLQKTLE